MEGELNVNVGGDKSDNRILKVGEKAVAPINTWHRWWNEGDKTAAVIIEVRPAQNFEASIRAAFGLMSDGKTNNMGIPKNIWELALIFELAESYTRSIPIPVQLSIFGFLGRLARKLGYDPNFSRYTKV